MKLVNKFTIWYLCFTLASMLIGVTVAYFKVKSGIDQAEINRLKIYNDLMAKQIAKGDSPDIYMRGRPSEIVLLNPNEVPVNKHEVFEHIFYNKQLEHRECRLTVKSYYNIHGKYYSISSYNYITKANEIMMGLLSSFAWNLVLLLVLSVLFARYVSRLILAPFNRTLAKVQSFNLKQKKKLQLAKSTTPELQTLNSFLNEMTDKALDEYRSLKEFTENASHELQTPLAILRSKLELLTESYLQGKDDATIAALINDMQNAIEKLSRINSSLTLLARLENHEYANTQSISVSQLLTEALSSFTELLEMKSIHLQTHIEDGVALQLHPSLADILLGNVLSNAIRHNQPTGSIEVVLNREALTIRNTGKPPLVPTSELFKRFTKGSHNSNSIGIGLAIVKQICDLNGLHIQYEYADNWHTIRIIFGETIHTSKLLQNDVVTLHPETQL
jgi:two-component system, OmpR family, sensor kinase